MANSLVAHGAIFAVGALVGGGIATAVIRKNSATSLQTVALPQYATTPILQVETIGNAVINTPDVGVVSPPLKYGNPGVYLSPLCG
jgi:endonuclease G